MVKETSESGVAGAIEVKPTPASTPLVDVLGGNERLEVRVHEHGFVALIDAMPRLVPAPTGDEATRGLTTADAAIVQAARVSYGTGTKRVSEDRGLIRYLLRHRHTTPFEMVEFKFHVAMPIFVARQWIRHRTANINEYSGRYSVVPDSFYHCEPRRQSTGNMQGGEETLSRADAPMTVQKFEEYLTRAEGLYQTYEELLKDGVSRELARIALPQSVYTQWYWKCDLHNILRFLSLRMDPHAQREIRDYANAMFALLEPIVPVTMEAWRDYEFESVRLTRLEVEALRRAAAGMNADQRAAITRDVEIDSENKRERAEWQEKLARLGLAGK